MSESVKQVESYATIAIKTPEELIRLVMTPNAKVMVSGRLLEHAGSLLDGELDNAERLSSVDLVKEFSRLRKIFKRLLTVDTDGSPEALEEIEITASRIKNSSRDRASFIVASRLMTEEQRMELIAILDSDGDDFS